MSAFSTPFTCLLGNLPAAVRSGLLRLLLPGSGLELVGPAATTEMLPALTRRLQPGVVMVSEDQLLGLEQLRGHYPVLLYSSQNPLPGMLREAARLGVYDHVPPAPPAGPAFVAWAAQVQRKLLAAQGSPVAIPEVFMPMRVRPLPLPPRGIIVLGGSTGGAMAVETIVRSLPASLPWAVLVAVHLPAHFTESLVERLRRATALPVLAAASGTRLTAGQVLVAPGGRNLVLRPVANSPWLGWQTDFAGEAGLDVPSVDMLMHSAARLAERNVLGIVLTGLGYDGTAGAQAIRQLGGTVIAQDEASSAVFSMPKSVIQAGLAQQVVPLSSIAEFIVRHVQAVPAGPLGRLSSRLQVVSAR